MGGDRAREAVARVASFEHRHDASARVLAGDLDDDCRELGEVGVGERELASGSPARESKPAEIITSSGLNRSAAGTSRYETRRESRRGRRRPGTAG